MKKNNNLSIHQQKALDKIPNYCKQISNILQLHLSGKYSPAQADNDISSRLKSICQLVEHINLNDGVH